jgi:hypothetical protein
VKPAASRLDATTPDRGPHGGLWLRRALPWLLFVVSVAATALVVVQRREDLALLEALDVASLVLLVVLQGGTSSCRAGASTSC